MIFNVRQQTLEFGRTLVKFAAAVSRILDMSQTYFTILAISFHDIIPVVQIPDLFRRNSYNSIFEV